MNFDLRAWRKEHGLSQRNVAEGCGIYMNAIIRYEKGVKYPKEQKRRYRNL